MKLSRLAVLLVLTVLAWTPSSCSKEKDQGQSANPPGSTGRPASTAEETPSGQMTAPPPSGLIPVSRRVAAPLIETQVVDGSSFSLVGNKGKVVLVDFWATWCPPCRKAIPHLIDIQKEYGSRGLQVVGISLDQLGKPAVDPFVKSAGINYPIIADPQGDLANLYGGIDAIPVLFMIDKSGRIAGKIEGYQSKEAILSAVRSLLQES